jgi:(2Fe-2S) ferredoxin
VPNPNADKLDGYDANSLTRVARGAGVVFPGATVPLPNSTCDSFVDIASVNITAPSAGFVQVASDVTARRNATGGSGTVGARLSASSGEASALIFGSAGTSAGQTILVPLSPTWLFPVAAAGAFTVTLQGCALRRRGRCLRREDDGGVLAVRSDRHWHARVVRAVEGWLVRRSRARRVGRRDCRLRPAVSRGCGPLFFKAHL